MSRLNAIERRLAPFAIPNLTLYLVIGQTFVYLTSMLGLLDVRYLLFVPALVVHGEWWRIFSFVFVPPPAHWLFIAFALYLLYLFGSALEQAWGALRYNLFLFTGYLLTVAFAFVTPGALATNIFIGGAIFLAFAWMNPDFTMLVFFILPVKIKWMALIAWVGYAYTFFTGGLAAKLGVVAAVGNFLIFFGKEIWERVRHGRRQMVRQTRSAPRKRDAEIRLIHRCSVCGRSSDSNPELDFRYRSEGTAEVCYCGDHLPQVGTENQGAGV